MPMVYQWDDAPHGLHHLDPQKVGARLERIRRRNGNLTAETVLDEARSKTSPLHPGFEWDDTTAAHQYRLEQARLIVRKIVYIPAGLDGGEPIRAFVRVVETNGRSHNVYQSTSVALSDSEMRAQVLARAKAELTACARRYQHLEELANVIAAINEIQAA